MVGDHRLVGDDRMFIDDRMVGIIECLWMIEW